MKSKILIAVTAGLLISVLPVAGQGFPTSSGRSAEAGTVPALGNQPIAVGPFLFSPGLQLSWEHHSNLWQTAENPVKDDISVARLRLMFELPVHESFVRISYTPQYRKSKNRNLFNNWDHFLEVSGDFQFSNGLTLQAAYHMVSGDVATDEVDPGGELVYSGRTFTKHSLGLDTNYWFSQTDGLGVHVDASTVSWSGEPVSGTTSWYDYNQTSARAGWLHQISPTMVMDLSLGYKDYSPSGQLVRARQYTGDSVSLGIRGQLNDVLSTELRIGYESTSFNKASASIPGFKDFSGAVVSGNVTWAMANGSKFRLDLLRQPFASNYDLNSYYTATGGRLLWDLDLGRRLYGQARMRFQTNDYNVPDSLTGQKRSDDLTIYGAGLGFRLTDLMSIRGSYLHEDRKTIDPYGYKNRVIMIDLIVGY